MMSITFLLWLLLITKGFCEASRKTHRGPTFRTEPPSKVEFSNSSGTELHCGAEGVPNPRMKWHARDTGGTVDVPRLRYMRPDGTLVFPPFDSSDYRQDVHDAVYQCSATNTVGSIVSKEVHVRGVLRQNFNPEVHDVVVVRGNTAVLRCHLPTHVREIVLVDSWIRSDESIFKLADTRMRSHTVLFSGELLIHETEERDSSWSYHCQTRNRLTEEIVISATPGKITITEPHSSTLPRIIFSQSQMRAEEGASMQLPCVAQGNPPPTYKWLKDVNGIPRLVKEDTRMWQIQGTLNIKRVMLSDAGKYQCIARNSIGERRIESTLIVTAALSANLLPPQQTLSIGRDATFTCNVTGYPIHTIFWKKDQLPVQVSPRIQLLSQDVLHISSIRREDKGMYQCFVYNDRDGAQGSAELKISDVPPSLISVFLEHTAHSGEPISLKCISMGNPIPQVTWHLDGPMIGKSARIITSNYVTDNGHVVSYLNISDTRVEDGGEYTCHVTNDVGSASHAARLNVFGPIFVRTMTNVTAISGEDLTIRCPYGGYPIKNVRWYKGGTLLPLNHRQKVSHGGTLTIQTVQRIADEGAYSCFVSSVDGHTATGTTHVVVMVSPVIDQNFFRERNMVDEGSRTKLVCAVTRGDPPLRFHWMKNGLPFVPHSNTTVQTTEDSSIINFKRVTSADRGLYECVVTNMAASANITMQLIVNVPPQWTVEPHNMTVVLGNTVWMDCAAIGFPTPSVLWKKLIYTENMAGDFTYVHLSPRAHRYSNGTLVLSDAEENDSGAYLCQANNGIGVSLGKIVSLQVLVPPRFKETFKNKAGREGSSATLQCSATGHPPITITWYKNKVVFDVSNLTRFSVRNFVKNHQTVSELQITNTSRNDTGMYSCRAISDSGTDEAILQFVVQGLPDAPSNITVVNMTSRSMTLQWEVLHNGNSHITGSIVQYQTTSDSSWNEHTSELIVSGVDTTATLRELSPATLYHVMVMSENVIGRSSRSEVVHITTEEEAPAGYPRDVRVQSTGPHSMKVTWKPPTEELQFGHLKGYLIGYKISSSPENYTYVTVEKTVENGPQSTYITGLQPLQKYDIVVKAYNSAGSGPISNKIIEKTLETAPPTSPIIQVADIRPFTMDITWKKDSKDKSTITEYTLYYKADNGDWKQKRPSSNTERFSLTGLRCGTKYHLYMTAANSLGIGEPSVPIYARTQGAAPLSPQGSAFLQPNTTSVFLNLSAWQSRGCPIDHFTIKYRLKNQSKWTTENNQLQMSRGSYVIRHLSPDQEYFVMVTAHSDAGLTQGEYTFRTLAVVLSVPTSPAYGKRETDLAFYKNTALILPIVVSTLVLLVLLFAIVFCFKKHSKDRRGYENQKPPSEPQAMGDISTQMKSKTVMFSHYSCPEGDKGDYEETYFCNEPIPAHKASDGDLFATIKRCHPRPIYMSAS